MGLESKTDIFSFRYKSKFMELVTVYKDMVTERDKFKVNKFVMQYLWLWRVSDILDFQDMIDSQYMYNF